MTEFNRADVLRILRISPKQLSGWQRAGLVAVGESFSFFDLIQLKKVRDLRAQRVKPTVIRESLLAMRQQVTGMSNPLVEAGIVRVGSRVAYRHDGVAVDPIDGQFVMNFEPVGKVVAAPNVRSIALDETAADHFARGVALEEDPITYADAIAEYKKVVEIDPKYAPAHINLGTLYYNQGDYVLAEQHYREAISCDSRYALAYFDLGNVLDETGRIDEAIKTYDTALQLAPTYADAHYNIALAYEKTQEPRKALKHWRAYIKLDANGAWSVYARNQIKRILEADKLRLVYRRKNEERALSV